MQFGGSGATSGRDSGFCIMINSPSHTSLVVQQFLSENNFPVITQPPYSPNRSPSDFWLFLTPKMGSRGHVSQPWGTPYRMRRPNQKIPKEAFHRCFQECQDSWSKCVCACVCACVPKGHTLIVIR
jgi:hypothetical protein